MTGENRALSSVHLNYGVVWSLKQDWDRAIKAFELCLDIRSKTKDPYIIGYARYRFGQMYRDMGDKKKARKQFEEALRLFKEIKDDHHIEIVSKEINDLEDD